MRGLRLAWFLRPYGLRLALAVLILPKNWIVTSTCAPGMQRVGLLREEWDVLTEYWKSRQ